METRGPHKCIINHSMNKLKNLNRVVCALCLLAMSNSAGLSWVMIIRLSSVTSLDVAMFQCKCCLCWRNEDDNCEEIVCDILNLTFSFVSSFSCTHLLCWTANQSEVFHWQRRLYKLNQLRKYTDGVLWSWRDTRTRSTRETCIHRCSRRAWWPIVGLTCKGPYLHWLLIS